MANIFLQNSAPTPTIGATSAPQPVINNPTVGFTSGTSSQPGITSLAGMSNYLHPALQSFLSMIPRSVVMSHPATPIFMNTHPQMAATATQPLPAMGPNASRPIGNTGNAGQFTPPAFGHGAPSFSPTPISDAQAAAQSGVIAGPTAINHVPYGPELTGMSGYGGLITPNGTPVAMSAWQKANLDPTSIAHYNSYVSDIAGMNPADLAKIGANETGEPGTPTLHAPTKFMPIDVAPTPVGGG